MSLPQDIWNVIISFLPYSSQIRVARVSVAWKTFVYNHLGRSGTEEIPFGNSITAISRRYDYGWHLLEFDSGFSQQYKTLPLTDIIHLYDSQVDIFDGKSHRVSISITHENYVGSIAWNTGGEMEIRKIHMTMKDKQF